MKRNENLKTLSWEHHDGLVVSFRLQQGLKKKANTKEMVEYILHTWDTILEHHFWQEEHTIIPNVETEAGIELIEQLKIDHKQIRQIINQLKNDQSNSNYIKKFADLLNKHIRFEERQLFPQFEKEMGETRLAEIGKFLKEHHKNSCEVWQNQFWKN